MEQLVDEPVLIWNASTCRLRMSQLSHHAGLSNDMLTAVPNALFSIKKIVLLSDSIFMHVYELHFLI